MNYFSIINIYNTSTRIWMLCNRCIKLIMSYILFFTIISKLFFLFSPLKKSVKSIKYFVNWGSKIIVLSISSWLSLTKLQTSTIALPLFKSFKYHFVFSAGFKLFFCKKQWYNDLIPLIEVVKLSKSICEFLGFLNSYLNIYSITYKLLTFFLNILIIKLKNALSMKSSFVSILSIIRSKSNLCTLE